MWWSWYFILLLSVVTIENALGVSRLDPLVDSKAGLIRGLTATDGSYSMFMGIPYAKVDENNPFGPSTPYPKFEQTFEAYDDSAMCPQVYALNKTVLGTLDCLILNIYVPRVATSLNKLPVMVHIHGGLFQRGSGGLINYGPKYLVQHDVILITLNYRLGPYGFMCLDTPEVPGNQGLKDQVLALQWIKNNIEAFGGNAQKITVFGISAGAHSIDFLMMYGDQKLFQNVILQSGSSLASTVVIEPDREAPQKILEYLGTSTNSVTEALALLANTDPLLVINAVNNLNMNFKPCIEQKFDNVEPFITRSWINVEKPKVKGKPIMLGFNEFEKDLDFVDPEKYINENIFRENLELTFDFDSETLSEMEQLVRHFYVGNEPISESVRLNLVNFSSDFTYIHPMQRSINKYIENQAKNIYYYMFSYVGGRNTGQISNNITSEYAGHSDELGYLFDPGFYENRDPSREDQHKIDQMTTMWTNFAKYGDPTPDISELLPVKWTPLSIENYHYLKIGSELTLEKRPAHNRMTFWNLFYMLNEKSQKLYEDAE